MADTNTELSAAKAAVDELIRTIAGCGTNWDQPAAPGKWSAAQIVEHVARGLEEGSPNDSGGRFERLPRVPRPLRFVARNLYFKRALRSGQFPTGKTNPDMDPVAGPQTVEAGRQRLERAWEAFERWTAEQSADEATMSPVFGPVPLADLVRFMTLHVQHHTKQIPVP